jgi:iron(III) transport system permease protein
MLWGRDAGLFGSLAASALLLGICLAPLVLLATRASLRAVDPELEAAAQLAAGPWSALRGVTLPLALPGIARSAGLVFLLAIGDLAVPTTLGIRVFPTESFTQFAAAYRVSAATAFAVPLLLLALLVLFFETRASGTRIASTRRIVSDAGRARFSLGRTRGPLSALACTFAIALVALPLAALIRGAFAPGVLAEAWQRAGAAALRSVRWAAVGASLLTLVGALLGYAVERRASAAALAADRLALVLFATPPTVLGIGLVALWNHAATTWIYATPAIVLLGWLGQYAAVPSRLVASAVAAISPRMEEAAALQGARWPQRMLRIVTPLAAPGLAAAWFASFLFCLRDLGIAMIVYPPGADTLPVRTFTLMANAPAPLLAALCLIIVAASLGPLVLLAVSLQRMAAR